MKITSSSIGMDSARTYTSVSREAYSEKTKVNVNFLGALSSKSEDLISKAEKEDTSKKGVVEDQNNNQQSFDDIFNQMKSFATSSAYEERLERDHMNRIKVQCIQYLLMLLFGKRGQPDGKNTSYEEFKKENLSKNSSNDGTQIGSVTHEEWYYSFEAESETTDFTTEGVVKTSDGREISFNLNLSMSRQFAHYMEERSSYTTSYIDPLVINFDTDAANVSDVKISFDLDADGEEESVSRLSEGSGYLALDLNGDGIINDGSELFGTSSGDGFKDLSAYDLDGNGWIDEADEIFDKLRICVQNEDGSQSLYKLMDKGVGAIGLQNVDTDFSLNNLETNDINARIRKTGIFLYENGGVGTVQHLDLAQ